MVSRGTSCFVHRVRWKHWVHHWMQRDHTKGGTSYDLHTETKRTKTHCALSIECLFLGHCLPSKVVLSSMVKGDREKKTIIFLECHDDHFSPISLVLHHTSPLLVPISPSLRHLSVHLKNKLSFSWGDTACWRSEGHSWEKKTTNKSPAHADLWPGKPRANYSNGAESWTGRRDRERV